MTLLIINRTRQNMSQEIVDLKNILNKLDLIDTYRTLHQTMVEYTFFSSANPTTPRTPYDKPFLVNYII